MKTGLVLEGGALRGLFSAGIMDVLMEEGIEFDGIIGVSAGAAFGCNYKSRQPGRVIRYNTRFANDWRYCSFRSLLKTGDLYGGEFCYHTLPDQLDLFDTEAFDHNPTAFYAVCTDVETGEAVYQRIDTCGYESYEWFRASASMPLAARVVEIGGRKLLDGGVADSIPLKFFQGIGYERNLVILTQPADYVKKPNAWLPLMRLSLRKYPKFLRAMETRHVMYNAQLDYVRAEEKKGNTLVIRPTERFPIEYKSHDPALMRAVHQQGRDTATAMMDEIRRFLSRP